MTDRHPGLEPKALAPTLGCPGGFWEGRDLPVTTQHPLSPCPFSPLPASTSPRVSAGPHDPACCPATALGGPLARDTGTLVKRPER